MDLTNDSGNLDALEFADVNEESDDDNDEDSEDDLAEEIDAFDSLTTPEREELLENTAEVRAAIEKVHVIEL